MNYRHKILQPCYSNTDILSEKFLLEKSKELLTTNLVFRACLLAESSLLKLNRPCTELNYFHKDLKKNVCRRVHSLK